MKDSFLLNLIIKDKKIAGITLFDEKEEKLKVINVKAVILATGGYAGLYKNYTTNVNIATGDAIASGLRAGLRVNGMEFIQFHPTGLEGTNYLISEAARGEGGRLINSDGDSFVDELNTRDFVTRAIVKELQRGKKVYLDLTEIDEEIINTKLINLKKRVKALKGIDIAKEPIPINPLAHYTMGGISTDPIGKTDIAGLFVVGEAGNNGVNGANRLGGNSLSEGAVFGKLAGYLAVKFAYKYDYISIDDNDVNKDVDFLDKIISLRDYVDTKYFKDEVGKILFNEVGIIRNGYKLKKAFNIFNDLENKFFAKDTKVEKPANIKDLLEIYNSFIIAKATILGALKREESRGSHFRLDYPERDFRFQKDIFIDINDIRELL